MVGLAEDGREDDKVDAVVEEGAEGDGRGLDGREVWRNIDEFLIIVIGRGSFGEWREDDERGSSGENWGAFDEFSTYIEETL